MIEFFSVIEGVAEAYPVVQAKKALPSWVSEARKEKNDATSITKCPGIFELFGAGYILPLPWDVEVESTNQRLEAFMNPVMEELLKKPPVQIQDGDSIAKHLPKRPWSNKSVLKINTPWHIKSKHKVMILPMAYSEAMDFESSIGLLDPSVSSEINVQGYVNFFGVKTLKAGYPLCHIVPMTDEKIESIVRDANDEDEKWVRKKRFLDNSTFTLNRNLIRSIYRRFIKKDW